MSEFYCGMKHSSFDCDFDDSWLSKFIDDFLEEQGNNEIDAAFRSAVEYILDYDKTIHSYNPLLFNYLTDEIAKETVYFYHFKKNKIMKLFDYPVALKKLEFLSPGEVICDLYLDDLE